MPTHSGQIDAVIEIITPENIAFRYELAGPFRRALAYAVDLLVRGFVFFIGAIVVGFISTWVKLPGFGIAVILVGWFLLDWFYGGLFETYWNGQTPGKRFMQIRVLSMDGQPVGGLQAVLRTILRIVDLQPVYLGLVGLVATVMNNRFQRLGDLACGTIVVLEERGWLQGVVQINEPEAIRLAGEIPASFQASQTLARALSAYVHRRPYFSEGRRQEISRHVGKPLCEQFGFPVNTDLDQLLCAVYHRTFGTDRAEGGRCKADEASTKILDPIALRP